MENKLELFEDEMISNTESDDEGESVIVWLDTFY